MIDDKKARKKYGEPSPTNPCMILWDVPAHLEIGLIPKRIFCNKDLITPLATAFGLLIHSGCVQELRTWDGCFNIRPIRGVDNKMSLHSWGLAVDVNAYENGLGQVPKLSPEFVKCFTDAGFDWGGKFKRKDGMHFQLANI